MNNVTINLLFLVGLLLAVLGFKYFSVIASKIKWIFKAKLKEGASSNIEKTEESTIKSQYCSFRNDEFSKIETQELLPLDEQQLNNHNSSDFYRERMHELILASTLRGEYPLVFFEDNQGVKKEPVRYSRIIPKGVCEPMFYEVLKGEYEEELFEGYAFEIPNSLLSRNYTPDFIIKCQDAKLVIEIDEKYSGETREPTHYINSYDEDRNKYLSSIGWTTVRFAEEQIYFNSEGCLAFVSLVLCYLNNEVTTDYQVIESLKNYSRWTFDQSQEFEKENYREKFLGVNFKIRSEENTEKIIEYDVNTLRKEIPHVKYENVEFIARTGAVQNAPLTDNFKKDDSNPSQSGSASFGKIELSGSELGSNSKLALLLELIASNDLFFCHYNSSFGIIDPIRVFEFDSKLWLEGIEVIFNRTRFYCLENIGVEKIEIVSRDFFINFKEYSSRTNENRIEFLVRHKYICSFDYTSKNGVNSIWRLSNISYSSEFQGCIEGYSPRTSSRMTFSIRKMKDIEIFPLKSWPEHYGSFGEVKHPEKVIAENPKITSKESLAKSSKSNQGCLIVLAALMSIFIFIFFSF